MCKCWLSTNYEKIIINIQEAEVFKFTAGRSMPGAGDYVRKNTVDFKVLHFKKITES